MVIVILSILFLGSGILVYTTGIKRILLSAQELKRAKMMYQDARVEHEKAHTLYLKIRDIQERKDRHASYRRKAAVYS